jgi:zinc and cadmium transporter
MNAETNHVAQLWLYCLFAFGAALAGGSLPWLMRLRHAGLQIAVSMVAGLMLGFALLGLVPHSVQAAGSVQQSMLWLLAGFLAMFFLQRVLPFHHHDVSESVHDARTSAAALAEISARHLTWMGVAAGLSIHSVLDGVALAASVAAESRSAASLGLGTALMVILHKPFGALAIATLMAASGLSLRQSQAVNVAFASVTPAAALLFHSGFGSWAHAHPAGMGIVLAFCAGTFLCIACADLLPELQFHSHDRLQLSAALLLGLAIAFAISRLPHGTRHDPGGPEPSSMLESACLRPGRPEQASLAKWAAVGGRLETIYAKQSSKHHRRTPYRSILG